jgi:hypothetical protein
MRYRKGDVVRVVADPYNYGGASHLGACLGQIATVTKVPRTASGDHRLVSLRFTTGVRVMAWLTRDANNNETLVKLPVGRR